MAVKSVAWTRDLVMRFWDGVAQTRLSEMSFGALEGESCLQVFSPFLDRNKSYIDFGGGDGHFARLLCAHGYRVATYDISEGRGRRASEALSEYAGTFLGHVAPGGGQKFAGVFCLEVAEHVLDEDIASTYQQIYDLLEPGGLLFLTTPNQEDLDLGFTLEPQSGALFHRWQHVRAFNRGSLAAMLKPFGLNEVLIHEIEFRKEIFAAVNKATAGVGNIFDAKRPVYFSSHPNLAGVFSKGAPPFKVDEFPCNVSMRAVADISPDVLLGAPNGWQAIPLPAASIAPVGGSCFACGLETVDRWDGPDHTAASLIRLYEDGVQLGPPHASHDEIQRSGAGMYSHWERRLYFSSSDGSDPRLNGRRYEVRAPVWTLRLDDERMRGALSQILERDERMRGALSQILERDERLREAQSLITSLNERLGEAQSQIVAGQSQIIEANERFYQADSQVTELKKTLGEAQSYTSRLEETIARLRARSFKGVLRRLRGQTI